MSFGRLGDRGLSSPDTNQRVVAPDAWRGKAPNVGDPTAPGEYVVVYENDAKDEVEAFVTAGGPVVEDRLLVYGIYNFRDIAEDNFTGGGELRLGGGNGSGRVCRRRNRCSVSDVRIAHALSATENGACRFAVRLWAELIDGAEVVAMAAES